MHWYENNILHTIFYNSDMLRSILIIFRDDDDDDDDVDDDDDDDDDQIIKLDRHVSKLW